MKYLFNFAVLITLCTVCASSNKNMALRQHYPVRIYKPYDDAGYALFCQMDSSQNIYYKTQHHLEGGVDVDQIVSTTLNGKSRFTIDGENVFEAIHIWNNALLALSRDTSIMVYTLDGKFVSKTKFKLPNRRVSLTGSYFWNNLLILHTYFLSSFAYLKMPEKIFASPFVITADTVCPFIVKERIFKQGTRVELERETLPIDSKYSGWFTYEEINTHIAQSDRFICLCKGYGMELRDQRYFVFDKQNLYFKEIGELPDSIFGPSSSNYETSNAFIHDSLLFMVNNEDELNSINIFKAIEDSPPLKLLPQRHSIKKNKKSN